MYFKEMMTTITQSIETETNPRCKKCKSTQVRIRFYKMEKVCNHCGFIEKLKFENVDDVEEESE